MIIVDLIRNFFEMHGHDKTPPVKRLYWEYYIKNREQLYRYCINLFRWNDALPCEQATHESYLTVSGFDGIVVDKKEGLLIVNGGLNGVTNYPNEFTQIVYATPKTSGTLKFGKNGELCKANRSYMSLWRLIDLYANVLAHIELSIQAASINLRSNMLLAATNQAGADSINAWYTKLEVGEIMAIIDKQDLMSKLDVNSINNYPTYNPTNNVLTELYGIKQNIIRDFFTEIGFVSDKSKQERLVTAELSVNTFRVVYGVSDMLEERKLFCERTNSNKVVRAELKKDLEVEFNEMIVAEIKELIIGGEPNGSQNNRSVTKNNSREISI